MTGGGQHGVNGIAGTVCKIIAAHAVLGLEMTDHWFDGGAPPQLLAAFRAMSGRGNTDLYPKLVWPMRLALADALHFRRVQGIDFGSALTLILRQHAPGEARRPGEDFFELEIAVDALRSRWSRQDMDEEAANELVCCERHHLVAIGAFDPIVLVLEADSVFVKRDQSAVGDSDAMGIAG